MKKLSVTMLALTVLSFLFAIAFQTGKTAGFRMGSEWALLQADIIAREEGMSLPVQLKDGVFHVVYKQPRGLYQKAWQLADRHDQATQGFQVARQEKVEMDKSCVQEQKL